MRCLAKPAAGKSPAVQAVLRATPNMRSTVSLVNTRCSAFILGQTLDVANILKFYHIRFCFVLEIFVEKEPAPFSHQKRGRPLFSEGPFSANENSRHRRGFVGELARKRQVACLQRIIGLIHEAAGSVVLRAAVGVERSVVDAL